MDVLFVCLDGWMDDLSLTIILSLFYFYFHADVTARPRGIFTRSELVIVIVIALRKSTDPIESWC